MMRPIQSSNQEVGFAFLCSPDGLILQVVRDDYGVIGSVDTSQGFISILDSGSLQKGSQFLATVRLKGATFDWELNSSIGGHIQNFHFASCLLGDSMLIIGSRSRSGMLALFEETAEMNHGLGKASLSDWKSSRSSGDDNLYCELSRVNNELINAQRQLAQKNVRLERSAEQLRKSEEDLERRVQERTLVLEGEVKVRQLAEEKLRALSASLIHIQDEERRRVARDLHDTAGQTLTALKIGLANLQRSAAQSEVTSQFFSELNALADQALREIRTTSYLLHPPLLDEAGFASAARIYVDGFNKRSDIQVRLQVPESTRIPYPVEIALFRVLQESLTNVTRHSGTATVDVLLEVRRDVATLTVRDYGKGIPPERLERMKELGSDVGVGIAGMRERMRELRGKLEIQSDAKGTVLTASVPITEMENEPVKSVFGVLGRSAPAA
jgi:signal transduction histidine kinase